MLQRPSYILPCIVLAQLLGTSTWFAGNAILPVLQAQWGLADSAVAPLTNSVQLGFIVGALVFAVLTLADRLSPRVLFFLSALGGAFFNSLIALWAETLEDILLLRFLGGFFLAGVYPVGMKIASAWYPEGLGRALGFLVGALVIGTASAHLFSALVAEQWRYVIYLCSAASFIGGLVILFGVPDGPAMHRGAPLRLSGLIAASRQPALRASAGGYFGHMWELYAVYALVPYWLLAWSAQHHQDLSVSLWAFVIIGIGGLGCMVGGYVSLRTGSRRVAAVNLAVSGCCCVLSPLIFASDLFALVLFFWLVWGWSVAADSPQFSSLSAQTAPSDAVGSALTMINAVGFTITIIAVQLTGWLLTYLPVQWVMWLLIPGPILGLLSLRRLQTLRPTL